MRTQQTGIDSGDSKRIDQSIVLALPVTSTAELQLEGTVVDHDGASASDVVRWHIPYRVTDLNGTIHGRRRESDNGDPDITLHWRIEVIDDNSGTTCPT